MPTVLRISRQIAAGLLGIALFGACSSASAAGAGSDMPATSSPPVSVETDRRQIDRRQEDAADQRVERQQRDQRSRVDADQDRFYADQVVREKIRIDAFEDRSADYYKRP